MELRRIANIRERERLAKRFASREHWASLIRFNGKATYVNAKYIICISCNNNNKPNLGMDDVDERCARSYVVYCKDKIAHTRR